MKRLAFSVALVVVSFALAVACGSFSGDEPTVVADAQADRPVVQPGEDGGAEGGADGGADAPAPRPSTVGCSDGTREGFVDSEAGIAACQGAWKKPGVFPDAGQQCLRRAGNDGAVKNGVGCGAEDLCAFGWHVCRDAADVATHGGGATGEICQSVATNGGTFYATAQPSDGDVKCGTDGGPGLNDVFGCGDTLSGVNDCLPLNKSISITQTVPGFDVGLDDSQERKNVTKGQGIGGVLCCLN